MSDTQQPQDTPDFRDRVLGPGTDPDPRFTLANERTFLAWIRTSLAFLAGGIALEAFAADLFDEPSVRMILGSILLVIGAVIGLTAAWRWLRVERSMRVKGSLPLPGWAPVLSVVCGLAGLVVLIVVWF